MRRLAVALSGLLFATACSSDPILARDLNPTTTTTTTTTAAPLTTASTATTTTLPPVPDVSDVLRIAYDQLIGAEALFYISYDDSALGVRRTQAGRWNVDGTGDLVISRTPAGGSATLTELAMKTDAAELQTLRANLGASFEYRFLADEESWVLAPTSENWSGTRTMTETDAALGEATDAALYLDPFFASIVEIVGDPVTDSEGTTTFALVLDADTIVPFLAPDPDAGNLLDADWDGVSAAMTTGTITLDTNGRITGASVDQTPWWQVGWEFAGVAEAFADAELGWAIAVQASPERFDITAPCDNPGTGPDETVGADLLICPA